MAAHLEIYTVTEAQMARYRAAGGPTQVGTAWFVLDVNGQLVEVVLGSGLPFGESLKLIPTPYPQAVSDPVDGVLIRGSDGTYYLMAATVVIPVAQIENLVATDEDSTTVSLAYDPDDNADTYEYSMKLTAESEFDEPVEHTGNITALIPETSYDFRIRGVNAIGPGPWSDSDTVVTPAA